MEEQTPAMTEVLGTVLKAVPHPHLIDRIDLDEANGVVRFNWRGTRYRVDRNLRCEEVGDGVLVGGDLSILMERCLRLVSSEIRAGRFVLPA